MSITNYSQNPKYATYRDLIGLNVWVKIKNSKKNQNNQEFFSGGIVIDETYNTLITSHEENPMNYNKIQKIFIKKNHIFRFELENTTEIITIEVDGKKLLKRPENRLKMLRKKRRK
ncbi:MAG: ribonuclease P protein subunit [archaeon]|nr:ribonuclease P protein subunit [archaeon]